MTYKLSQFDLILELIVKDLGLLAEINSEVFDQLKTLSFLKTHLQERIEIVTWMKEINNLGVNFYIYEHKHPFTIPILQHHSIRLAGKNNENYRNP